MNPSVAHRIAPVNVNLITATGESSPFIEQIDVEICLGNHSYHHNVLVADISNEAILGMDFLVSNNCDVLLSQNKLSVKGETIQCFHYASNAKSCYRVAIQETTEVPPNSEIFISGKPNVFESGQVGLDKDQNEKFRNLLIELVIYSQKPQMILTFRTILRPVKNGVNVLIKKSRISVL